MRLEKIKMILKKMKEEHDCGILILCCSLA